MSRNRPLLSLLALCATSACKSRTAAPGTIEGGGGASAAGALTATFSAQRCGECHNLMYDGWVGSAHAKSARSATYIGMRAAARRSGHEGAEAAQACDRCHAPLRGLTDARDPAVEEGVTCDVCHTIRSAEGKRAGGAFVMVPNENVRMGPLCDARDHYFHRMGCSPLHTEARFCAGCHLYYRNAGTPEELPIYTEYEEWLASPYPALEEGCQGCHMPDSRDEVARGWPMRDGVPHHGFLANDGMLRRRALTLKLEVEDRDGRLHVTVTLANKGAGHRVPTGLPERRLVLRVRTLDEAGATVAGDERVYGRLLADDAGRVVPSFAATQVASDNRLVPRETRVESFDLAGPPAGEVRAQLAYQPVAPDIALQIGTAAPPEQLLLEASVPFDAPGSHRHRRRLPAAQVAKVDGP
jgi:hypothetical protein